MVPWGSPSGLPVTSIADAREQVGRLLDNGADLIKVAVESGSSFGRTIPTLSLGQLRAVVEVAHERGSRVSAHVLTSEDLERALDGGVDDIAHMVTDLLPDRLVRRMVKTQTTWVPTLELWHGVRPDLGQVAISNLAKFVRAGGRVALGTDYAGYSSLFDLGMPLREIAWMEQAGMEPMAIIVAATREAARVCNAESRFGTLEVGKGADLLVAQGDPLADLRALQSVHMVIQRGSIIRGA
jgi:imidazolonepropionase-like amidohydrolase